MQTVRQVVLVLGVLLGGAVSSASGQPEPLELSGGSPVLYVRASSVPGVLLPDVNQQTYLRFRLQPVPTKVTVHTDCPGQSFTLLVEAVGLSAGFAAPAAELRHGAAPVDLVTGIPAHPGYRPEEGFVRYAAYATAEQGNSAEEGADLHTVTYTLVQQ